MTPSAATIVAASIAAVAALAATAASIVSAVITTRFARQTALQQSRIGADAQLRLHLVERSGQAIETALQELSSAQTHAVNAANDLISAAQDGKPGSLRLDKVRLRKAIVFLPTELEAAYDEAANFIAAQLLILIAARTQDPSKTKADKPLLVWEKTLESTSEAIERFEKAAREWKRDNWAALMPIAEDAPSTELAKSEKD